MSPPSTALPPTTRATVIVAFAALVAGTANSLLTRILLATPCDASCGTVAPPLALGHSEKGDGRAIPWLNGTTIVTSPSRGLTPRDSIARAARAPAAETDDDAPTPEPEPSPSTAPSPAPSPLPEPFAKPV
jgi:hypothetical protein